MKLIKAVLLFLSFQVAFLSFGSLPARPVALNDGVIVKKEQPEKTIPVFGELESLIEEENVETENEFPLPVFIFLFYRNQEVSVIDRGAFDESDAFSNTHCPRYLRIRKLTL